MREPCGGAKPRDGGSGVAASRWQSQAAQEAKPTGHLHRTCMRFSSLIASPQRLPACTGGPRRLPWRATRTRPESAAPAPPRAARASSASFSSTMNRNCGHVGVGGVEAGSGGWAHVPGGTGSRGGSKPWQRAPTISFRTCSFRRGRASHVSPVTCGQRPQGSLPVSAAASGAGPGAHTPTTPTAALLVPAPLFPAHQAHQAVPQRVLHHQRLLALAAACGTSAAAAACVQTGSGQGSGARAGVPSWQPTGRPTQAHTQPAATAPRARACRDVALARALQLGKQLQQRRYVRRVGALGAAGRGGRTRQPLGVGGKCSA